MNFDEDRKLLSKYSTDYEEEKIDKTKKIVNSLVLLRRCRFSQPRNSIAANVGFVDIFKYKVVSICHTHTHTNNCISRK